MTTFKGFKGFNDRIEWLQNAIATLRAYRKSGDFSTISEVELIINICEYEEELEGLLRIKRDNSSLFN